MRRFFFTVGFLGAVSATAQTELRPLLGRGPLVLIEENAEGKFGQATGMVLIDAPVEKVWTTLTSFEKYVEFMPKVSTCEVLRREGAEVDVHVVIETPGPDTDYTIRYALDEAAHEVRGTWLKGDLKGSRWRWRLEPTPDGKTLLSHQIAVKNFSDLATSFEDGQQTITMAVNVGSTLAATKAIKRRAEGKPAGTKTP